MLKTSDNRCLVWHRRDLRMDDNTAFCEALAAGFVPEGIFVFDTTILSLLPKSDRRIEFIQKSVANLAESYAKYGCEFHILIGDPVHEIPQLTAKINACMLFYNRDYEPKAIARDHAIETTLGEKGVQVQSFKDHVIFESHEVLTHHGNPFSVFTPYKNAWLKKFHDQSPRVVKPYDLLKKLRLPPLSPSVAPSLEILNFSQPAPLTLDCSPGEKGGKRAAQKFAQNIATYHETRNSPFQDTTSRLGVHLRFGTVSIRRLALWAMALGHSGATTWLDELIWRDFYSMILASHPRVADGGSFQPVFDNLAWGNDPARILAWQNGKTGIPIVDAGMRQLNATGFMHNRLRMITASYFVKQLDCDWRIGEAYFAAKLMDFDLASNNGGWQWCSSTGCDAQPYFRIFNPKLQSERFDPAGEFIKLWVPELRNLEPKDIHAPHEAATASLARAGLRIGVDYPLPLVQHATAREAAISKYKRIKT